MPSTLVLVQILAVALLVVSSAETFRARPWWPKPVGRSPQRPPARGSAPRERRWVHAGLAVMLAGNAASMASGDDESGWALAAAGLLLGLVMVVVGLVRGPTAAELARYEAEVRGGRVD